MLMTINLPQLKSTLHIHIRHFVSNYINFS